jgi:hypothetical protein
MKINGGKTEHLDRRHEIDSFEIGSHLPYNTFGISYRIRKGE